MKRFNPAAPVEWTVDQGLIIEEGDRSVYERIAARADLEPGSQQLLVGGIGSGKTTELWLAVRWLGRQGKTVPFFIDITEMTDLSQLNSGALLAALGLQMAATVETRTAGQAVSGEALAAIRQVKALAYGRHSLFDWVPELLPSDVFGRIPRPGKLPPRFPPSDRDVKELRAALDTLARAVLAPGEEVVAIFDGLDRLMTAERFRTVVEQDFQALREMQISVVAAAPLSVLIGPGREVADHFDVVHHLPAAVADPKRSGFLRRILERRGISDLLAVDSADELCRASGGVLRDLMSLVRNAAEDAYLDGQDTIQETHVAGSAKRLGQSYLLGLGPKQGTVLRNLRGGGSFSPDDPMHLELLLSRRVLEYRPDRYEVHPALAPLL
jgi:hypothetical protein